jgi:hypothetical protein
MNISPLVCSFYISEVPPARLGGRKITLFQLASFIGIVAVIVTNTGLLSWQETIKGTNSAGADGFMIEHEEWKLVRQNSCKIN